MTNTQNTTASRVAAFNARNTMTPDDRAWEIITHELTRLGFTTVDPGMFAVTAALENIQGGHTVCRVLRDDTDVNVYAVTPVGMVWSATFTNAPTFLVVSAARSAIEGF